MLGKDRVGQTPSSRGYPMTEIGLIGDGIIVIGLVLFVLLYILSIETAEPPDDLPISGMDL